MTELNPKILERLIEKTGLSETTIRSALSRIRSKYNVTLNAAAHIFAQKKGFNVSRWLKEEDRESLRNIKIERISIKVYSRRKKKINKIAEFETENLFLKSHIDEINKTYTYGCYTACFVLMRKVLENLIVEVLRKKYSGRQKEHREKYYDFTRSRNHDFNVLLKNLRESSSDFGTERRLVERICNLANSFKETANEMVHSLYYIAMKKEIDEINFQQILVLIKDLLSKI